VREEALDNNGLRFFTCQFHTDRTADHATATAKHRERARLSIGICQQAFLGFAAGMGEPSELVLIERHAAITTKLGRHRVGQRQVEIVAAEQDVIANRDTLETKIAAVIAHFNEAKVCGAATDVTDEHALARIHHLAPVCLMLVKPGIKGCLWLFEKCHMQAGVFGRFHSQVAGDGIERGRNR
jgi:hypothetical protein